MKTAMYIKVSLAFFFPAGIFLQAQSDTAFKSLKFSGYAEAYYSYDFGNPANHIRPGFVYSFNRHNEVNINLAYMQANYEKEGVRSSVSLMAGTYAQYNLAAEHPVFQHVLEANVGAELSKSGNLWIDAGILPSHIGFEGVVGMNCWNLTRSILADNSPYFESGVRLGYTSADTKFYLAGLLLNGWQRIRRIPGNNTPAFGTQLTYKPDTNITLNWSTYAGNEFPDSAGRWRYFNNFYGILQINRRLGVTVGFDIGLQEKSNYTGGYDMWYSPVLLVRFSPGSKINIAVRAEHYSDGDQVIIRTGTANGFQTTGYSVNFDLIPRRNFVWRIEGRVFSSRDRIFVENSGPSNDNYFVTSSIALSF